VDETVNKRFRRLLDARRVLKGGNDFGFAHEVRRWRL
jgi:hypothetical protein